MLWHTYSHTHSQTHIYYRFTTKKLKIINLLHFRFVVLFLLYHGYFNGIFFFVTFFLLFSLRVCAIFVSSFQQRMNHTNAQAIKQAGLATAQRPGYAEPETQSVIIQTNVRQLWHNKVVHSTYDASTSAAMPANLSTAQTDKIANRC